MKIRIRFNGSFTGIIYSSGIKKQIITIEQSKQVSVRSKGFAYDPLCVYVNGTGRDYYEFYIQLNRCGTLGGNTHNLDSRKQPTVTALTLFKSARSKHKRRPFFAEKKKNKTTKTDDEAPCSRQRDGLSMEMHNEG